MGLFNKKTVAPKSELDVMDAQQGGFRNMLGKGASLQGSKDILKNTTFTRVIRLSQEVCENIFISSWVGKKIIEIPVNRALKNGLILEMDDKAKEKEVWKIWKDLKMEALIIKAQRSADIYGSSIILLKDKTQDPLGVAKDYKSLEPILVEYPFYSVSPSSQNSLEPGLVTFSNLGITADISFCAVFTGSAVPSRLAPEYKFFGMSAFQNLWNAIVNDATIMTAVANITYRSSIRHYRLKGLKSQVLAGRIDQVLQRVGLLDESASIFGSVVMDEEDDMQIISQSLSGLADIDKRSGERLSAASGLPATLLLGKSPDGQNSTGESDDDNFVAFVENYQQKMQPPIDKISAATITLAGAENKDWNMRFKTPDAVSFDKKPDFEAKILLNASAMLNELSLPEDVVKRYLLENNIIMQEEHDNLSLEELEFDSLDEEETESTQNN